MKTFKLLLNRLPIITSSVVHMIVRFPSCSWVKSPPLFPMALFFMWHTRVLTTFPNWSPINIPMYIHAQTRTKCHMSTDFVTSFSLPPGWVASSSIFTEFLLHNSSNHGYDTSTEDWQYSKHLIQSVILKFSTTKKMF